MLFSFPSRLLDKIYYLQSLSIVHLRHSLRPNRGPNLFVFFKFCVITLLFYLNICPRLYLLSYRKYNL